MSPVWSLSLPEEGAELLVIIRAPLSQVASLRNAHEFEYETRLCATRHDIGHLDVRL